jgi:hypothetical protein
LFVGFVRLVIGQLSVGQHIGLECALWYLKFEIIDLTLKYF